eukprot:TRINITY_DN21211_c0_g1_i1.p1 TRINITY_DN21211_c0_g1~~TRINITY_DN21211_c0_g1_i1.p1  ORF type:complete len:640 (+),score=142.16 TRINITY_DN21211_c0_g1_i1:51-1970(+)
MAAADFPRALPPGDRGGGAVARGRGGPGDFRVGDVVIAAGLSSNPAYNGHEGRVVGTQTGAEGEEQVLVVFSGHGPKAKALMKDNLINKTTSQARAKARLDADATAAYGAPPRSPRSSVNSSHATAPGATATPPLPLVPPPHGHSVYAAPRTPTGAGGQRAPHVPGNSIPGPDAGVAAVQVVKNPGETDLGCILTDMVLKGVRPDSPAARAGVSQYIGLRLVEVDGVPVHTRTSSSVHSTLQSRVVTLTFELPAAGRSEAARRDSGRHSPQQRSIPSPSASAYPEFAHRAAALAAAAARQAHFQDPTGALAVQHVQLPQVVEGDVVHSPRGGRPRIMAYAAQQDEDDAKEKLISMLREENGRLKERVAVAEAIAARADQEAERLRGEVAMLLANMRAAPPTPPPVQQPTHSPSPLFVPNPPPTPSIGHPVVPNPPPPPGTIEHAPSTHLTLQNSLHAGPPAAGSIAGPTPATVAVVAPPVAPEVPAAGHVVPALPPSPRARLQPTIAAANPFSQQYSNAFHAVHQPTTAAYPRREATQPPPSPDLARTTAAAPAYAPRVDPALHQRPPEAVFPYAAVTSSRPGPAVQVGGYLNHQNLSPRAGRGTEVLRSQSGSSRQPSPPWEQQQPEPVRVRPASVIV